MNRVDNILLAVLIIYSNYYLIEACYITNCPWGGKRSVGESLFHAESSHSCRKCFNGLGTCFGPKICCVPEVGCLMDTKHTQTCEKEDLDVQTPCVPYGKSCDKIEFGKCATNSLCCNPESCVVDANCSETDNLDNGQDGSESLFDNSQKEKKIKELLKLLLKQKDSAARN